MTHPTRLALSLLVALAGSAVSYAAPLPVPPGYAEGVYSDYTAATRNIVVFDLAERESGSMRSLGDRNLASLVGYPTMVIEASESGVHIEKPQFVTVANKVIDQAQLDARLDQFESVGRPLDLGTYRLFDVVATIGKQEHRYQAAEFCWRTQNHCVVYDPSIEFLDSIVRNNRQAALDGWGPKIEYSSPTPAKVTAAGRCGLASRPTSTRISSRWPNRRITYHNVFGVLMIQKDLAFQEAGVACDVQCRAQPFGASNVSSGFGNFGYGVACDNQPGNGATVREGKYIAETKCTHRLFLNASANATLLNQGTLGVSIAWQTEGSVDGQGGTLRDTCAFF
ncbi:hypothetical protein [Tahibacter amnicola]|uniref:Uncharacterized protein n=1 Tax=Tahibacter amnicola TaxID=2976241 RepID=A0ABY6BEY2_9GAMM|nr:hypothetical protein [Tahibacter amnicola]UXI68077.1 hypothetical protein N4264_00030 [Tahibacter amnicola]